MLKEAEIDNLNSSSTAADIDVEEESANRGNIEVLMNYAQFKMIYLIKAANYIMEV